MLLEKAVVQASTVVVHIDPFDLYLRVLHPDFEVFINFFIRQHTS